MESTHASPLILLFSYGTLQDRAVQMSQFRREWIGYPDSLPGYTQSLVAIRDAQVVAASGKIHHPIVQPSTNPADTVPGTVFKITAEELAAADAYEVSDYRRVSVVLASGKHAWVYVRS